ncbi:MAG: hypothetical protein FWG05_02010 [Kiritimatiellaeota bacterium]|nr:hypothetical protein [Kiritimatiellota bacterium]
MKDMQVQKNNRFVKALSVAVRAIRDAVRYDIMLLRVRSYLTESEQIAVAFLLAVLALGLVKKYFL